MSVMCYMSVCQRSISGVVFTGLVCSVEAGFAPEFDEADSWADEFDCLHDSHDFLRTNVHSKFSLCSRVF